MRLQDLMPKGLMNRIALPEAAFTNMRGSGLIPQEAICICVIRFE
jgi:hypothetical protein